MVRLAALLALAVALALPAAAFAQGSPFTPLPSGPQDTTSNSPVTIGTPTAPNHDDRGGSTTPAARTGLLAAGGVLIALIAPVIVRDARRSAPRRRRAAAPGPPPRSTVPGARGRPTGKASAAKRR